MIVQESDILLAALDRRLQVDRALPLGPVTALGGAADEGDSLVARAQSDTSSPGAAARVLPSATAAADQTSLAARLPLGRVVDARVVSSSDDGQVTADIERWRVALAWPAGGGPMPLAGDDVRLRVLAHEPMLLFQNVDEAPRDSDEPSVHWSRAALELARQATARPRSAGSTSVDGAVRRFTAPILDVETHVPLPELASGSDSIAIDDVVVGRSLSESPDVARTASVTDPALPIVLQGPAWAGQPTELVVRRERADSEFENAVLDHWCSDVTIDLPRLGRVAGHLSLSMQGLKLRLEGEDAAAVDTMTAAAAELAVAFGASGLRVQTLSVGSMHPGLSGITGTAEP